MRPNLNLTINNSAIIRVNVTKYLGILIDENLNWKAHIEDVCLSLRKYVGVFYKLSLKLPAKILRMLYFSLIYPRILYCIEIYANTYMTYLHDLIILNNRILRILQHKPLSTHINDLYISFNSLPINLLFHQQMLLHAHSIYYNSSKLPDIFKNQRQLNSDIHNYDTRSSQDFHRLSMNSSFGKKSSSNMCAKLWNMLPANIKSIGNQSTFKKLLKQYLQSNNNSFITGD